jgi:transitional endoplasmic reticulum ATPase
MADPAIDSLRAALGIAPEDVTLHVLLAERLAGRGDVAAAIEEYRAAVRLSPHDRPLRLALARAFLVAERYAAAEVVADELLGEDATLAAALLVRARALSGRHRSTEALAAYKAAIAQDGALADEGLAIALGLAAGETSDASGEPTPGARPGSLPLEPLGANRHGDPIEAPDDTEQRYLRINGVDVERARISFGDVGGMEALKEQIRLKILYPRQHPELYGAYAKRAGGGILLYGPPGCGKTHLARATSGELGAAFISVGIADVLEMWVGSSERNLHQIFEVARAHTPCVLFFDEIDALAASRSDFKSTAGRQLINQFLAELDGADSSNDGLLVIGATNAPWHMDSAFRRPGRFDQIVFVPPPDLEARTEIVRVLLRERPAGGVDVGSVAAATEGYSGADLMAVIDQAIERKLAQAIRDGIPRPLTTDDLTRAVRLVRPSTGEWFSTVRNYVLYANEAGLYDPVRPYLKQ